jgi:tRNA threonylcarbamoyladenosine biosynthesis protein TsaE
VPVLLVYSSSSPETTRSIADALCDKLIAGDVILLQGDLGAGKTEFVKGLAAGLGVDEPVTSPTFALLNVYQGRLPLYHFDLYRLDRLEELDGIGFDEFIGGDGLAVIEWPDRFAAALPEEFLKIIILPGETVMQRTIKIEPTGDRYIGRWEGSGSN